MGGNININADKLIVRDAGRVNAESRGNGDAGNLQITAKEILLDNGGRLRAETVGGERGNIFLNADSSLSLPLSNDLNPRAFMPRRGQKICETLILVLKIEICKQAISRIYEREIWLLFWRFYSRACKLQNIKHLWRD
ncbi:hypothetical protein [Scytonema sp. PRP1]|uniref:hypothetical protein n=1 Tax=Scytonema sp. PRP1 TaxID=3120513 RepID=UPI002FD08430